MAESVDLGTPDLEAEIANHVLTVRIVRAARRNAMTIAMYRGVKRAAILADGDPQVDVLCLTGTDEVFCVGGDMSGEGATDPSLQGELDVTDHFPFRHLERCQKAVLSAVNGTCYAGGLNLLLFSDLSIAAERARFRAPELLRGAPDPWLASRLAAYVGVGVAKYWMYTAEVWDARRALEAGLVGRVVPDADFDAAVGETIEAMLSAGPKSRAMVKETMNRQLAAPDASMFKRAILSPEMVEGMKAFLEKRPPEWPR